MPWVRFEDDWYDDDELSNAHPLSVLLWATAISWSARNLKDGLIPAGRIDMLVNWRRAGVPDPQPHIDELIDLGKFQPVPSGYLIPNYHHYQPTRASVLAKREADAERQRRNRAESSQRPDDVAADSNDCPSPPGPGPEGSLSSVVVDVPGTSPQDGDGWGGSVPEPVWVEYARLKRAQSKTPVRNIARYDATTIENGKREHGSTAARWWRDFDISVNELAAALVDGSAGRSWLRRSA